MAMEDRNLEVQNIEQCEYGEPYNCNTFRQELTAIKSDSAGIIERLRVQKEQIDKEHKETCAVRAVSSILCIFGFLWSYQYGEETRFLVIFFTAVTLFAWWWTARKKNVRNQCMKDVGSIGLRLEKMLKNSKHLWQAYFEEGVELLHQAKELSRSNQPLEPENNLPAQGMLVALFLRVLSTIVTLIGSNPLIAMANFGKWEKLDDAKTMLDFGAMGYDLMVLVTIMHQDVGCTCRLSQQITQSIENIKQLMQPMLLFSICLKINPATTEIQQQT